jgi:DNA-binding LytR/AlgR family response regulator
MAVHSLESQSRTVFVEEDAVGSTGTRGLVVLAVDDEEPALDELTHLLAAHPEVATVLRTSDPGEALRILDGRSVQAHGGVDAVFIDIRMPGLDGVGLVRRCARLANPPAVVVVTAQQTRAVEAYEAGAVDYLLKPVRSARLQLSLGRLRPVRVRDEVAPGDEVLVAELAGRVSFVRRGAVRCVQAHGDYVRVHTDTASHLVRVPLAVLEQRWACAGFLRVHRSYLVAIPAVTALRADRAGHVLLLGDGPTTLRVPVARRQIARVRRHLRGEPILRSA